MFQSIYIYERHCWHCPYSMVCCFSFEEISPNFYRIIEWLYIYVSYFGFCMRAQGSNYWAIQAKWLPWGCSLCPKTTKNEVKLICHFQTLPKVRTVLFRYWSKQKWRPFEGKNIKFFKIYGIFSYKQVSKSVFRYNHWRQDMQWTFFTPAYDNWCFIVHTLFWNMQIIVQFLANFGGNLSQYLSIDNSVRNTKHLG